VYIVDYVAAPGKTSRAHDENKTNTIWPEIYQKV